MEQSNQISIDSETARVLREGMRRWKTRKNKEIEKKKKGREKEKVGRESIMSMERGKRISMETYTEELLREKTERWKTRKNKETEKKKEGGESIMSERDKWGNSTEEWLCDAAVRGDVESLNEIIEIDNYILDRVLAGTFKGKNPLHVAVSTGRIKFVVKLIEAQFDLVKALDTKLGSALHIASSQGNLEIVELLLTISPGMCVARDREGNNPLHIAAMQGKDKVLKVLLQASPHAARVKVDRGDTILHLCVNYNQLESLKLLLEMVGDQEFVNSTDTNGNNILHLAVFGKRVEIVKHLLWESKIDVNARNGSEWTALDIIYRIKKKEDRKGEDDSKKKEDSIEDGKEDRSTKKEDRKDGYDIIEDVLRNKNAKRRKELFFPFEASWQKKKKETLMIVSSLIATIAFQVGVYPPGGVWVDNAPDHVAGKAITAYNYPNAYRYFMYFNTIGFLLSLTTILELIVALPEKHKFMKFIRSMISWMTIMATAFAYTFSVNVISPSDNYEKPVSHAILVTVILWATVITYFHLLPGHVFFYRLLPDNVKNNVRKIAGLVTAGLKEFALFLVACISCIVMTDHKRRSRRSPAYV